MSLDFEAIPYSVLVSSMSSYISTKFVQIRPLGLKWLLKILSEITRPQASPSKHLSSLIKL